MLTANDSPLYILSRPANGQPPEQITLMLHGWTGDEHSMEVFARGLSHSHWLLFPRGPLAAPGGGYGWAPPRETDWPDLEKFVPAAHQLMAQVDRLLEAAGMPGHTLNAAGFSQGAAMVYALAVLFPQRFSLCGALSGFFPQLSNGYTLSSNWSSMRFYISHGTQDETVPVEKGRDAARLVGAAGAQVQYCESQTGHRLGLDCFRGLTAFLTA